MATNKTVHTAFLNIVDRISEPCNKSLKKFSYFSHSGKMWRDERPGTGTLSQGHCKIESVVTVIVC